MKIVETLIAGALLGSAAPASDGKAWAYVPATRDVESIGGLEIPNPPRDGIVTFVGTVRVAGARQSEPQHVLTLEIPIFSSERVDASLPEKLAAPAILAEAHWPDSHGRIATSPAQHPKQAVSRGMRNPWEVQALAKSVEKEIIFECGGILIGGEGGSIALLNRRIVRRNDSLGEFNVAGVFAIGVILRRNGSYYVIPMGQPTTLAIADG